MQRQFPQLSVQGLHDDITIIVANKRADFDAFTEAAIYMSPLLEEQHSRMNMSKSRYMYYGSSAMPEETTAAIKEAGIKLVTKLRFNNGRCRQKTSLHTYTGCRCMGPNSEAIADMVLQDAREKTKSLEKIMLLYRSKMQW